MRKSLGLISILLVCLANVFSQVGHLDPAFGDNGKVSTNILDINKGSEAVNAIAVQADGKIVAVGTTMSPGMILRYNTDGTLDNSFSDDGMFFAFGYKLQNVIIQADGKILATGAGFVMRLNTNGTPDNSFDGDGIASGVSGSSTSFFPIALQSDGKIIVANVTTVMRLNINGSPDNSFDGDGQASVGFGTGSSEIRGIAVQTDGKIVFSGFVANGTYLFGVARCNADGSPDNSFDGDGIVTTSISGNDQGSSVAIQNDGKIVVCGHTNFAFNIVVARYNTNGSLDNSFDGDGKVTTVINTTALLPSMVLQSDGKILVSMSNPSDFAVLRYNTDGSPDNSFDGDGLASIDFLGTDDRATCMAVQSNGKIVLGGFRLMPAARDFALVCYNSNGSPDNSFDSDGRVTAYFGTSYDIPTSLAVQNDGKIVVAGYTGTVDLSTQNDFAITRYNPNGTLDNSFDGDGRVVTPMNNIADDKAMAVAIQSDGKIVVAGIGRFSTSSYDVAVARYNSNGSLDNSFDGDGMAVIVPTSSNDFVYSLAIQPDGKILIAGSSLLIRLNSNGTPDNSFDGDGIMTTSLGGRVCIALQSDGKIIIGGSLNGDFAMFRYNTNGSLDNSFDGDGLVTTDINGTGDGIVSLAIQSDGKIVAGGMSDTYFAVARYNTNGSLDNSFDTDGKQTADMGGVFVTAVSVAIQSSGKIILAGENRKSNGQDGDFILARFNTNGSPDNSFDGDGKVTLDLWGNSFEHLSDMKVYSDRIYMAGQMQNQSAVDFVLAAAVGESQQSPLPLQLITFSGKLDNSDGLLTWKTENETNMDEYVIERSLDGRQYVPVGSVKANNAVNVHEYNFRDFNIASLNVPVVYYRLKQKGMDGGYADSRIVALPLEKNKNIVLFYPNPVIHTVNLAMTVDRRQKLLVRITDNKGSLVKQQPWDVLAGSASLSIDVQNLPSGMYYLEIKGDGVDYKKQFVKQY